MFPFVINSAAVENLSFMYLPKKCASGGSSPSMSQCINKLASLFLRICQAAKMLFELHRPQTLHMGDLTGTCSNRCTSSSPPLLLFTVKNF